MKVVELVKISRELLKVLSENDVRINDWKHLKMFDEFMTMRQNGIKYRYAVSHLSATYGISRANVERTIRRLGKVLNDITL